MVDNNLHFRRSHITSIKLILFLFISIFFLVSDRNLHLSNKIRLHSSYIIEPIYNIAEARIKEIIELMLSKNINFSHFNKDFNDVFFEINPKTQLKTLEETFKSIFSMYKNYNLIIIDCLTSETLINTANKLVHFGWKNEAIPISQITQSKIARFFDAIFG